MTPYMLFKNIVLSYKMYFHLVKKTFVNTRNTQARLTVRRFFTMAVFCLLLFILQTLHWISYILDDIFFRGYRSVQVKKPLFVVGVPRSGTTFLHRFLAGDTDNFSTISLWELILAPSVTERKIISYISKIDTWIGSPLNKAVHFLERKAFGSLDDIHKISFSDPEEDYFALAPVYACFIMILPFPFPEDLGDLAFFDTRFPEKDKDRIMAFYKTCLQRHLYVRGKEKIILSKNVSFGPMIRALEKTFPDCRIIGTVRNPLMAVPSHISSMMEGAAIFDNDVKGRTFRDQMIEVQRYAYSHLAAELSNLPESRSLIIKMEDLQTALYESIQAIYHRFDYEMSPQFQTFLKKEDRRQKSYKSNHHYDLAAYDLTHHEIYRIFSDVFSRFNYTPHINI